MSFFGSIEITGSDDCSFTSSIFGCGDEFTRENLSKAININDTTDIKNDEREEILKELDRLLVDAEEDHAKDTMRIGKVCIHMSQLIKEWSIRYWYTFGCMFPTKFYGLLYCLTEFSRADFLDNFTTNQIRELLRLRVVANNHDSGEEEEQNYAKRDEEKFMSFYRPTMVEARKVRRLINDIIWNWKYNSTFDESHEAQIYQGGDPKVLAFLRDSNQFKNYISPYHNKVGLYYDIECIVVFQYDYVELLLFKLQQQQPDSTSSGSSGSDNDKIE